MEWVTPKGQNDLGRNSVLKCSKKGENAFFPNGRSVGIPQYLLREISNKELQK
jgi:hypothetical protein